MALGSKDWDADSPKLSRNLRKVQLRARDSARSREAPTLDLVRQWHRGMMEGLAVPDPAWIGTFRGEKGAEGWEVKVGSLLGSLSTEVASELASFISLFEEAINLLDEAVEGGEVESENDLKLVIRTAAWAHAEWIRIHPFVNGNGRTARLWANWLFMRFGLPPLIRLRPRPGGDAYTRASAEAMGGDWRPTVAVFEGLLRELLL